MNGYYVVYAVEGGVQVDGPYGSEVEAEARKAEVLDGHPDAHVSRTPPGRPEVDQTEADG